MGHMAVDTIERQLVLLDDAPTARRFAWRVAWVTTALKLVVAATTFGTDDVHYWLGFVGGVRDHGPFGLYALAFPGTLYNHGPVTSWYLLLISRLSELGLSVPFLIRVPSSIADMFTAVLLFDLVRTTRGPRAGALASAVLSIAPISFIISGFHGNTDPVFVMFALLAVQRLWVRHDGLGAGLAIGVAISIKVIPVVLIPIMFVAAWKLGRPTLRRFLLGGGLVFLVFWAPALLLVRQPFISHYLGYGGVTQREWGVSELLVLVGIPFPTVLELGFQARYLVVAVAALAPALLASRLPLGRSAAIAGMPLVILLVISPAFGAQYLSWALAASLLLVPLRVSITWITSASIFLILLYSEWNHAAPWNWYEARADSLPPWLLPVDMLTWYALVALLWIAVRDHRRLQVDHSSAQVQAVIAGASA